MNAKAKKKPAVFFDRDNTLIVDKIYLNDVTQVQYLPHVFNSLKRIRDAGYTIIVVTNQSGVAKGLVHLKNLHLIHQKIRADFAKNGIDIKGFYYAPFLESSHHAMRKPNPGMLLEAAFDHSIDLEASWMVGDRNTDIEAGLKAGTRNIFLTGTESPKAFTPTAFIARNLNEVADIIISE